MDPSSESLYRKRLLPFIDQWVEQNTRIAILGIGPHTDHLFCEVPELGKARIVAFLDSQKGRRSKRYRGLRVFPPEWADQHADVILCSSFVNEASMAAAMEPRSCKIVTSHTPPTARASEDQKDRYRLNRNATIEWLPSVPYQKGSSYDTLLDRQLNRYLSESSVIDSILDHCFPEIPIEETDVARALLRHLRPGHWVFEVGVRTPGITEMARVCCGPTGKIFVLQPHFPLNAHNVGMTVKYAETPATLEFFWVFGVNGENDRHAGSRRLRNHVQRLGRWTGPLAESNHFLCNRLAKCIRYRLRGRSVARWIRIDDEGICLPLLCSLLNLIAKHQVRLLFKLDENRWALGFRDVFQFLERNGYSLMVLENAYRQVTSAYYEQERRFGMVHILALPGATHELGNA